MSCKPSYKGVRFDSIDALKSYLSNKHKSIKNTMPSSELKIQLDVERDTDAQEKKLSTQIVNIVGVMSSDKNVYERLVGSIAHIISNYANKVLTDNGKPSPIIFQQVKNMFSMHGFTERLHIQKMANNKEIGLTFAKSKVFSMITSLLNKRIMPNLPGNSYAQGTIEADVYVYEDGTVSVGYIDSSKKLVSQRGLQTMRMLYDGKELVPIKDANGKVISPIEQFEELSKDPKKKAKLEIKQGEVIMPYPYRKEFNLPANSSLAESRQIIAERYKDNPALQKKMLDEFEKSLEIISLRIPLSNGSLGGKYRIVEFIEDSGNTILIPSEKNILDGSDQDIDMQHVFFYPLDEEVRKQADSHRDILDEVAQDNGETELDDTEKTTELVEKEQTGIDEQTTIGLQKEIFGSLRDYYSNPDNVRMIFTPVSLDLFKEEAERVSKEELNVGRTEKIATPDGDMKMHNQNQAGKQVGYFANMNSFFGRLLSLRNQIGSGKLINSKVIKIFSATNDAAAAIIDFTNKFVNAATDNAKNNFNGRLNVNDDTSAVIAGINAIGVINNNPESMRAAIRILRSPILLKAVADINKSISLNRLNPNVYKDRLSEYFISKVPKDSIIDTKKYYNEKVDKEFKEKYGLPNTVPDDEAFMNVAYKFVLAHRNGDIKIDEKDEGKFESVANVFFAKVSIIGDKIVNYGLITSITQEIPTTISGVNEFIDRFEKNIGMSLEDFLDGKEKSVDERVAYSLQKDMRSRSLLDEEEERMTIYYKTMFDPTKNFDDITLLRMMPNFMETMKALKHLRDVVAPKTNISQAILNRMYPEGLRKNNDDAYMRFDALADAYAIGKYLSKEYSNLNFNGRTYDLSSAFGRISFIYDFNDFMKSVLNDNSSDISNSELSNYIIFDTSYETGLPIMQFDIDYNEDPAVVANLERDLYKLEQEYPGIKEMLGVYNLIVYGDKTSKGSFVDLVIDTKSHINYSKFSEELSKNIENANSIELGKFIDRDEFFNNAICMAPDLFLNKYSKKNSKGLKFNTIMRMAKGRHNVAKIQYVLMDDGKKKIPIGGNEYNVYGTRNVMLLNAYETIPLEMDVYKALMDSPNKEIEVNGNRSVLIPYSTNIVDGKGQFTGTTYYGDTVVINFEASNGSKTFKKYRIKYIPIYGEETRNQIEAVKNENDEIACNL